MLYYIRTFGRGGKSYVKIGWTDNIDKRQRTYKTDNPLYEPISTREGDELLEKKLHLFLTSLGVKAGFMNEWFIDVPEINTYFHSTIGKLNKTIWKNRDNLFTVSDIKDSGHNIKRKIYEELRMIYQHKSKLNKEIDKAWVRESNLKLIKENRKIYRLR